MPSQIISLKDEVCKAYDQFCYNARSAVENAIRCGETLNLLKPMIKENPSTPNFGGWVEANLPFSYSSAKRYMKLYNDLEKLPKRTKVALLKQAPSVNGAIKLLPDFKVPKAPDSPQGPSGDDEDSESSEGSNGSQTGSQSGGGVVIMSAAPLVDTLTKAHIGKIARGLTDIAIANGGEGPQFKRANDGLNELIKGMKEMRAGEK